MATKKDTFVEDTFPPAQLGNLAAIVAATQLGDNSFILLPEGLAKNFEQAGFAVLDKVNGEVVKDESGNIKVRARPEGIAYSEAHPATPTTDYEVGGGPENTSTATRNPSGFKRPEKIEVDTELAMPTGRRTRAERGSVYPFEELKVGQSFHIPATPEAPDPSKSLASSVSTANLKYSEEDASLPQRKTRTKNEDGTWGEKMVPGRKQLRKFFTQTVGKDDPKGPGVRVWREM